MIEMFKDFFGKPIDKIKNKRLFLFDMDGTIYRENDLFPGVKELLEKIKENGGNRLSFCDAILCKKCE